YLLGRKHGIEHVNQSGNPGPPAPGTPGSPNPSNPGPGPGNPPPPRPGLLTATDAAYFDGVYRFSDGPDEVSAVAVRADGAVMVIGYKNGATRVWQFDDATIDPFSTGPKSDGAPTHIQFDSTGAVVYMTCTGGTVAAPWKTPPESPLKIP